MSLREILLAIIVFSLLPWVLRRPQIGVMMYVWLSVMNPHRLVFTQTISYVAIVAGVTLFSALLSKDLKRPPLNMMTVALFLFLVWTGVTTIFALYPAESFEKWTTLLKTIVMAFLIPMLFHKKEDINLLIGVIVLSIGYFGIKGGVWILVTGGGERVYGPPGYILDNNAFAVAVIMIIPLLRYFQLTMTRRSVRWAILAVMVLCGVAVLGSYSRGALLAVSAMVAFLWWKGRMRVPALVLAIMLIPPLVAFMPDKWYGRMDTLTLSIEEMDTSASGRLNAWGTAINIAKARPWVGGGFVVDRVPVYERYSPVLGEKVRVAHSIYFQALGEHGYVGLGLFLLLYFAVWRKARWVSRATRDRPDLAWARDLSMMMQVTLVGFAVGGAFLSLVNFDVPYYLVGIMVATLALVERDLSAKTSAPAPAGAPRPLASIGRNHSPKPRSG